MVSLRNTLRKPARNLAVLLSALLCAKSLTVAANESAVEQEALCPGFVIIGDYGSGLSDVEKHLVCGDPDGPRGWRRIPNAQAEYNFRNFIQERGYFKPEFRREGDRTIVTVGLPTYVSRLEAPGAPAEVRLDRKRKVVGELLTPKLLDSVQRWVEQQLRGAGYPCPKVTSQADPESGVVRIIADAGPKQYLVQINEEPIPGVEPQTLRRYDAFRLDSLYNGDWMALTENRIAAQNILQSAHFAVSCEKEGAVATQQVVPGPPRLLAFGVGFNTEEGPLLRGSWTNSRLGTRASSYSLTATTSYRVQQITSVLNWYHLPYGSRRSLRPLIQLRHDNEPDNNTISARGQLAFATTWDDSWLGATFSSGPTLDLYRRLRGVGQPNSKFLSLESQLTVQTHDFEYYATSPRTGMQATLTFGLADSALFSTVSAQRVSFNWTGLWNYRNFDPPLLIFGWRGGFETTITGERPGPATVLPAPLLHYLGGSQNLRGFGRRELPDPEGALTTTYFSTEIRLSSVFPLGLEPMVLADAGLLSKEPLRLDRTLFWSPGFGIRWPTPIGVFRTTFARGYEGMTPRHWQFTLSYGEEF